MAQAKVKTLEATGTVVLETLTPIRRPRGVPPPNLDLTAIRLCKTRYRDLALRQRLLERLKPGTVNSPINEQCIGVLSEGRTMDMMYHWQYFADTPNHKQQRLLIKPSIFDNDPIHNITSHEYKQFLEDQMAQAFGREAMTLADTEAYRTQAIYRIIREIAISTGRCGANEPLSNAIKIDPSRPDPWQAPMDKYVPSGSTFVCGGLVDALRTAAYLDDEHLAWYIEPRYDDETGETKPTIALGSGLPLMPPPPPLYNYDEDGKLKQDVYDPQEDPGLLCYINALRSVADYLRIPDGTSAEPNRGYLSLMGVYTPSLIRLAMPSPGQLMSWEEAIVKETLEVMVSGKVHREDDGDAPSLKRISNVRTYLSETYGLQAFEADAMVHMARDMAKKLTESSMEEEKGMMLLRLDAYMNRAREALDLKAEMNAMKQIAMITGLTKQEGDQTAKDFIDVVRKVAAGAKYVSPTERQMTSDMLQSSEGQIGGIDAGALKAVADGE